uniref:Uncharacterized protein n=1 Tax=Fagus sylvatica TaxID=28930 RepID=A0A2N9F8L0_FAGSY
MRRPALQVLAVAATDVSSITTTMSSRPPYRGGRSQWRRGFSDRPYTGGRGQGQGQNQGQLVSGDSHFWSVRDANLGFRQGDSGRFSNQTGFRPPYNNQSQRHRHPQPYNNQSQQFRPFDPNQSVRPPHHFRPKPLDYRNWEYSTQAPPPNCGNFEYCICLFWMSFLIP